MNLYFETSPIDGRVHQQNISILMAGAVGNTLATFSAQYPGVFAPTDIYSFLPGTPVNPRTTIVWDPVNVKNLLIVCNGMESGDKVPALISGWSQNQPSANPVYPFEVAAQSIALAVPNPGAGSGYNNITIIGHSYGGAVAHFLARYIPGIASYTNVKIYTYGAPKPMPFASRAGLREINFRRVFLATDPVPCLPLGPDDASNVWSLFGVPTARNWARWRQMVTGLIFGTGLVTLTEAGNPPYADSWRFVLSMASWITGTNAFGNANHSLAAYYTAMVAVPAVTIPNPHPITAPERAPVPPTTLRLQENANLAQAQQAGTIAVDPHGAARGIASGIPLVPGLRYHGQKRGADQVVIYNGNIIAYTKNRRARRALVRQLNKTL